MSHLSEVFFAEKEVHETGKICPTNPGS